MTKRKEKTILFIKMKYKIIIVFILLLPKYLLQNGTLQSSAVRREPLNNAAGNLFLKVSWLKPSSSSLAGLQQPREADFNSRKIFQ